MNRESETLLSQLMTTPVGRRWILKAGLGSAVAIAATTLSRSANATAWAADLHQAATPAQASQSSSAAAASQPKPTANRTLQFALTPAVSGGISNLVLVANGARTPLVAHTAESRAALQSQGGIFATADLSKLSHYVQDVPLPADRAMLVSVHGMRRNREVLVAQSMHVPAATTLAMATLAANSAEGLRMMAGSDERLQSVGLNVAQVTTPQHVEQLDSFITTQDTAVAWASLHPQVANIDGAGPNAPSGMGAQVTKNLVGQQSKVKDLGNYMAGMHTRGLDLAAFPTITDPNGSATQFQFTDTTTKPQTVINTTCTTFQMNPDGDKDLPTATASAVTSGITAVRDQGTLGTVVEKPLSDYPNGTQFNTWQQSQGVTPQAKPYTPSPAPSPVALSGTAAINVKVKNSGDVFGTKTVVNGSFNSGQVPIRIYNNWVRWVHAYVQYLGADGKNLSANASASSPDTKYSQSLALVPQVFTVLGIPIWDKNTLDVTLNFPKDAVTARVLYCGLGSDINGGGWRQYFPDDAYPDGIAPHDEVLVPALITGIVTIGLNVFALATDTAIAGLWASIRPIVSNPGSRKAIEEILQVITKLSVAEAAAMGVASGGATYATISGQGGSTANIWETLLPLATIIPKILFSPQILFGAGAELIEMIAEMAATILANVTADKVSEAVPLAGQVMAIIAAVGDAATLAEVAAETIVAPWVIENEISLSYPASITIDRDPRAATFPVTARNWKLQAKIDGAVMPDTWTGTINPDGKIESDPVTVTATAPYGGQNIQWTVVFTDADGHQVGTGVSAQYPNDDPTKAPTEVEFAITELPATIDANTVFSRADTVIYSSTAGGYTWSSEATDTGTLANSGVQQVTGATVATTLGVVGVVFKQSDQYYVQGVPVAENGSTIALQPPSKPYARPPFLLFDSFVGKADVGNHVLLEPDDATDGYYLRQVTLDSDTGGISWDSTRALGLFTLPVSAAALHSSGRVITVHTDSGRVGMVHPADTQRAKLASYSSGPGTEIGLLQSPVAVAVTNAGVVLILEAGASQIAAFDLNGNPIKYFGSTSSQYRTPLASKGTYLDMAVDGADHIYLLYYTNDGSQPSDYHIDVYNPDGEALTTNSPGTNIARLAVDFWRSIFGVNYTALSAPGSTVAAPSISRFDPSERGTA